MLLRSLGRVRGTLQFRCGTVRCSDFASTWLVKSGLCADIEGDESLVKSRPSQFVLVDHETSAVCTDGIAPWNLRVFNLVRRRATARQS